MNESIVQIAKDLNNLLQAEVSSMVNGKSEYLVVTHQELHNDTRDSESNLLDELYEIHWMVSAYLQKVYLFGETREEIVERTSYYSTQGGVVGFTIRMVTWR